MNLEDADASYFGLILGAIPHLPEGTKETKNTWIEGVRF
jgi:hypothetical protein